MAIVKRKKMLTLKQGWAGIAQAGVQPLTIVADRQVVKASEPCLSPGGEGADSALGFERAPEGFHHGVIVAVAGATHADGDVVLGEQGPIVMAGVRAPWSA
jgi:hypothetical protein